MSTTSESINWREVKKLFPLDDCYTHLALPVITAHPRPVLNSIAYHADALNKNPYLHYSKKEQFYENILNSASDYLNTSKNLIAITESTTAGLSTIYMGFQMKKGDEVLTTSHDHYASDRTLYYKAKQSGATLKKISLYHDPANTSKSEILGNILSHITKKTRLIALTWVHSCTGVKLPIKNISEAIADINTNRTDEEKVILSLDAVHGFGVEDFDSIDELGCDFFIAGCHKWLHGPRGTGIIWGSEHGWSRVEPQSASFELEAFLPWRKKEHENDYCPKARLCCPGGFPAFEHRWALDEAFKFHLNLGKNNIANRIKYLSSLCKEEIVKIPKVTLHTPMSPDLSSGIVCFDIKGKTPTQVVNDCLDNKIMIGQTPYRNTCARITPSIINNESDITLALNLLKRYSKNGK